MSKIIITAKNKYRISLAKLVETIISVISSKKGNPFGSRYFNFGGSLLLAYANSCEVLSLLPGVVTFGALR